MARSFALSGRSSEADDAVASAGVDRPLDARARRTRAALRDALLGLVDERPLDQVTIREITARAGVGYASFFRHHATKERLVADVVEHEVAALLAVSTPAFAATDTYAAAHALCAYVASHAALWSTLLTGGASGSVREAFLRQASTLSGGQQGPDWLPDDLGVIHGVSSMVEILAWWLPRRDRYPVEAAATMIDRLVIAPAARRYG